MENIFLPAHDEPVSVFVSDTHLFHKRNSALDIQGNIIEQSNADRIYLLGDIIDYEYLQDMLVEHMESQHIGLHDIPKDFVDVLNMVAFPEMENHLRFWDVVMAQIDAGAEVHYITGNHDNNLDILHGTSAHGIQFHDHIVEEFGGIKTHLEHGDENDPACLINYSGLYAKCSKVLDASLVIDHKLKGIFEQISSKEDGYSFPITNSMKKVGKFFISSFRENAVARAQERGADATVLGHIHKEDIGIMRNLHPITNDNPQSVPLTLVENNGFKYRNTGDGLTHGTALIYNGQQNDYSDDGWHVLTRDHIEKNKTFDTTSENPYAQYREKTMALLQTGWDAYLQTADLTQEWDHAGARKGETVKRHEQIPNITAIPEYALYPENGI